MLRLRVIPAQGRPFDRLLEGDSFIIGRSSNADVVVFDPFLSRQHARLSRRGSIWMVEDLGSRNGTLINGRQVRGPTPLEPGDVIALSGSLLSLESLPGTGGALPTPATDHTLFRPAVQLLARQRSPTSAELERGDNLHRFTDRLRLVSEVHQELASLSSLEGILERLLERTFDELRPEEGAVVLLDAQGEPSQTVHRATEGTPEGGFWSSTLLREVAGKGMAALVLDARTDPRFSEADSVVASGVRSVAAAPLLAGDTPLGMIALSSRAAARQFSAEDLDLLTSLAAAAAGRIRSLSLAEEAAEGRRLQEDLDLARRIQLALLAPRLPAVAGYELHAGNLPSRGVSGDYYEVVERAGGDEVVLMVADVSGKGMAASLLTASLEALATVPIAEGLPPEEVCTRISRLLYDRTPPERYATVFLAVLEPSSGRLRWASAGHNPALLVRAEGSSLRLAATGLPLGLMPGATYAAGSDDLEPGDLLLIYTDGIVEAAGPEGEEYGLDRLEAFCRERRTLPAAALARELEADVEHHTQGVPYADDRTHVLVRRQPL